MSISVALCLEVVTGVLTWLHNTRLDCGLTNNR